MSGGFVSVCERIDRICRSRGEWTAVVDGDESTTYAQLASEASSVRSALADHGLGPNARIGVSAQPSATAVAALVGILAAGAVCVPLDPSFPSVRLQAMVDEADVQALLFADDAPALPRSAGPALRLADVVTDTVAPEEAAAIDPDSLAYVMFTSGSTGTPKGVAMPHRAVANLVGWQSGVLRLRNDRVAQFAPLSFDVSFQEILTTLAGGGTLVVVPSQARRDPEQLIELLARARVTRLFVPFVALQALAACAVGRAHELKTLRDVVTAGEQLRISGAISELFRQLPNCRLHNHYGPTETHVVTAYTLPAAVDQWGALPPVGKPIANVVAYVAMDETQLAPIGVPGEILVGGSGLAAGYYGRPEQTAERFVENPFEAEPARVYRTGDLGWWSEDGLLHFCGRIDAQVKVRGFRVEPAEVELALARHPQVKDAVVLADGRADSGSRLVACFVSDGRSLDPAAVQRFLRGQLPDPLVPRALLQFESLPLSPSGKVDRIECLARARALLHESSRGIREPELPSGSRRSLPTLLHIVGELLQRDDVEPSEDFFALGGDSLLAISLVSKIGDKVGVRPPLRTVFECGSLEQLAAELDAALRAKLPDEGELAQR